VVLVVFLALFQSILLSVFGLGAIRGERRGVEENMRSSAEYFLRNYVVARCQNELRDRADEVFQVAFDLRDPGWRRLVPQPGGGLFTDAFSVTGDGRIYTAHANPHALPVVLPRDIADSRAVAARDAAADLRRRFRQEGLDDRAKAQLDLAFARRHPFARDRLGMSLALVFAAGPLLTGEGAPDVETLLRMRWIGVLNRIAGFLPDAEVQDFLDRVAAAGRGNTHYAEGAQEQDRRARVIRALRKEQPRFSPSGPPLLHRNVLADDSVPFYVRQAGPTGDLQVLVLAPEALREFLKEVGVDAGARAAEGVAPRIVDDPAAALASDPSVEMEALPGYVATARISPAVVRARAGNRERFYWYIIGFSIAGILAGGFLTARLVMREVKLAKLKSGFVSNISHELKTPLTSIRMFSDMLLSGKVTDDDERKECLQVIGQETQRLSQLIQQVLDFGRLEARQRRFHWVHGSLLPVVEREIERFRRATGLDDDRFAVHFAVNLAPVTHDPDAFAEVVANLLSNAYKYSPPDDRRIELTVGPHRGRLVLAVEDNGPGVPARERRRIFDQFYRSADLLTREVEGTGLGLSIALNIVRAHGGRILVEQSGLGGSRFAVILPAGSRGKHRPAPQTGAEATS